MSHALLFMGKPADLQQVLREWVFVDCYSAARFPRIMSWLVGAFLLFVGMPAKAELIWARTDHESVAALGQTQEVVSFAFQNKGTYPVIIKKVQTSCGCTMIELDKYDYKPDEKGEIKATFKFGSRKGKQEKRAIVETDDPLHPRQILVVKVAIPDVIEIDKQELSWEVGDPLESQSVMVSIKSSANVKVKEIFTSDNEFQADLVEIPTGGAYRIEVTPFSTEKPHHGKLRISISDNGQNRDVYLKIRVQ